MTASMFHVTNPTLTPGRDNPTPLAPSSTALHSSTVPASFPLANVTWDAVPPGEETQASAHTPARVDAVPTLPLAPAADQGSQQHYNNIGKPRTSYTHTPT